MSELYIALKWFHIVSSTVLFGTGAGIAFFFVRAQRTRDIRVIAAVAADVVLADLVFTATAVILQPITGIALAALDGFSMRTTWLVVSVVLYGLVGVCWLPVVWLQIRMRNLAREAQRMGTSLPAIYAVYYRWWFALGWPAFLGVLVIFYLMIAKPSW